MSLKVRELIKLPQLILCAIVLIGLLLPWVDRANVATLYLTIVSLFAFVVWLFKFEEFPQIEKRIEFRWLTAIGFLFLFSLIAPAILSILSHGVGRDTLLLDVSSFALEFSKLLGILSGFLLSYRLSLTLTNARNNLNGIILVISFWAFVSIFMYVQDPTGLYGHSGKILNRLASTFSSANSAGNLFGAAASYCAIMLIKKFSERAGYAFSARVSIIDLIGLVFNISALFLTLSRGAAGATIIAIVVVIGLSVLKSKSNNVWATIALSSAIILVPILLGYANGTLERFTNYSQDYATRSRIFAEHWQYAKAHLWFGSGFGSFHEINNILLNENNYADLWPINALHNNYIQWIEETGVFGFALLVGLDALVVGFIIWKYFKSQDSDVRLLAIVTFHLVFLIHGLSDFAAQEPVIALINAIILGIGFASAGNMQNYKRKSEKPKDIKLIDL